MWRNWTRAAVMSAILAAGSAAWAAGGEFDGSTFSCLEYNNGQSATSSGRGAAMLARLWAAGYMTGYYRAQGKLELSADASDTQSFDSTLIRQCTEFPQNSIMTVLMEKVVSEPRKVPSIPAPDFSPASYTCGEHVDAAAGGAGGANRADLAELWAFAFIQGYKNVAQPDLMIPAENKAVLIGAVNKNCANNRGLTYMDLTAAVADKVKLQ